MHCDDWEVLVPDTIFEWSSVVIFIASGMTSLWHTARMMRRFAECRSCFMFVFMLMAILCAIYVMVLAFGVFILNTNGTKVARMIVFHLISILSTFVILPTILLMYRKSGWIPKWAAITIMVLSTVLFLGLYTPYIMFYISYCKISDNDVFANWYGRTLLAYYIFDTLLWEGLCVLAIFSLIRNRSKLMAVRSFDSANDEATFSVKAPNLESVKDIERRMVFKVACSRPVLLCAFNLTMFMLMMIVSCVLHFAFDSLAIENANEFLLQNNHRSDTLNVIRLYLGVVTGLSAVWIFNVLDYFKRLFTVQ